jgi:hypothetical protein
MNKSDSINELAAALAKAQAIMEAAAKDSDNPFFRSRYADLASCWAAWRPAGPPNGLALMQFPTATEERLDPPITVQADGDRKAKTIHFIQRVSVETLLIHSSGQFVSETLTVLVKDDSPQATLLGETYCRRGGMAAIIGIAPEDDDGNAASGHEADFGRRETRPPNPACPACGTNEHVIVGKPEYGGGFVCYAKKGGCGHKWHDAPKEELPDYSPGVQNEHGSGPPPKANGKKSEVKKLAEQHGMKTADELPPATPSETYRKAIDALTRAVAARNVEGVAAIANLAETRKAEGKLSEGEFKSLGNECTVALRKINAAEREPAAT